MMRKEYRFLVILIGVLLLTSSLFLATIVQPAEAATRDNRIEPRIIEGPDEFFNNETVTYVVEIRGAFRVDGEIIRASEADNWTLRTESSLQATIDPPEAESSTSNVFEVNVTVHEEGEGILTFTAFCGKNGQVSYSDREFSFRTEEPEKTSVTIRNPTNTHIEEMKVGLFIDGELKTTQKITDMEPGEERRITFQWSKRGLSPGEHTLEIWADYEPDEDTEFNQQAMIISRTFKVEEETSTLVYAGIIIAVIAVSFFVLLWYKSRKRKRRRPW